jgi:hypothetical protein
MASSGGLSRRRVGGGATSSNGDDDDGAQRGGSHPVLASRSETPSSANHLHAGSAFQGGSKIAFDPRDLQQDASEEARIGGKMPRLTIMEEVLLLGIKDKQVRDLFLVLWRDIEPSSFVLARKLSFFSEYHENFVGLMRCRTGLFVILERQHILCTKRMHPHRACSSSAHSTRTRPKSTTDTNY